MHLSQHFTVHERLFPIWAGLLLLALLMGPVAARADVQPLDRVVAVVDDDIVMQSELDQRMGQILNRMRQQNMPPPNLEVLRKRVLEQLVMESIQLQRATMAGIRISDNQLNETMARIAQSNGMTLEQFQQALASEGLSYAQAREQIRREMVISRYQQRRVEARIVISDAEVEAYLQSAEGKSQTSEEYLLGHILIAVPEQPSQEQLNEVQAKAQDLYRQLQQGADFQQLAVAHSDAQTALEGGLLGWRSAEQLPTLFVDLAPRMKVGEVAEPIAAGSGIHLIKLMDKRGGASQIVEQSRVRHILIRPTEIRSEYEAQQLIEQLYKRITQGGESFVDLAKAYSDDPASASTGGEMDWLNPGDTVPEFEKVMKASGLGEVSKPFRTPFGWHILEVLERRQQDIGAQLQEAQVRQLLFRRKFEEELESWLREIREEAYVEIKEQA